MDKYEYKVRADEIKRLVSEGDYVGAMEICDTIDWNRVKSVMMLCTVSDIYKINRRYEDSKNMLLLAYDRHPGGRQIVYSLCELSIKLEEFVQAIEYYKEFVQIAPKDTGKYILLYKLYEAQDAGLEDRIDVLKKLKQREYKEKWAYELAYLYHRNGNVTDCIEECDELILWFGEGKYVMKALELKMLHAPLTPEQQAKYDLWMGKTSPQKFQDTDSFTRITDRPADEAYREQTAAQPVEVPDAETKELDIHVKTMDVGQYNTINLQKALAESMKEVLDTGKPGQEPEQVQYAVPAQQPETEEAFDQTDPTSSVEAELPEEPARRKIDPDAEEIFFEDRTGTLEPIPELPKEQEKAAPSAADLVMQAMKRDWTGELPTEEVNHAQENSQSEMPGAEPTVAEPDQASAPTVVLPTTEENRQIEPDKSKFDNILSQEYDGQISLVVPESEKIEKQITGQMSIEDIMAEWERMKKENEQKRAEDVRRHVLEQTGNLFKDFEISSKSGLLEQLDGESGTASVVLPGTKELPSDLEEPVQEEEVPEENVPEQGEAEERSEEEAPTEIVEMEETEAETKDTVEAEEIEEAEEADEEDSEEPEEADEVEEMEEVSVETEEAAGEEEETEIKADAEKSDVSETDEAAETEQTEARALTDEERELFGQFIQSKGSRRQIVNALDNISLAAYTGNIIVTGDTGVGTMTLAKNLIREVQMTDHNFSGRVAKITASALNKKDIPSTFAKLSNGALIVQSAGNLNKETTKALYKTLNNENQGIIVVLEGTKKSIDRMLEENENLLERFNSRIDVEALGDDALVNFGRKYAHQMEYSIDEMGMLALHTRISDMQTMDHAVTIYEVRDIIDEAIEHADRKNVKHFFDILFRKRYDDEDMIILRENDFII